MAPLEREKLLTRLKGLRARGKTPLARSLKEAAGDLASGASADRQVKVILLTDGGEDTIPRQDPGKAAEELAQVKGVTVQIVGFDIGRDDWREELLGMTRRAHGRYLPASGAEDLPRELRSAALDVPDHYDILDMEGKRLTSGMFGESKMLPEGRYKVRTEFDGHALEKEFWVNTEATTAVLFDAAQLARTAGAAGAAGAPGAASAAGAKDVPPPAAGEAGKKGSPPPPSTPAACAKCKAPLKPGAKFCTECGTKVGV
jgi:hypothetical protein